MKRRNAGGSERGREPGIKKKCKRSANKKTKEGENKNKKLMRK